LFLLSREKIFFRKKRTSHILTSGVSLPKKIETKNIKMPPMTPLRSAKLAMADSRAMEEQHERMEDTQGMPQKKLPLAGGAKKGKAHKSPVEHSSFDVAEVEGHGRSLADHIDKLHGGAYRSAFMRGMSAFGNPDVAGVPVAFSNNVAEKAKGSKLKGGMARMVGAGPLKIDIEHSKMDSDCEDEMAGGVQTGRYEGEGRVDGRKARAAVVKKVMADRKCSMAQASKIVKDEGLYKK
jgi:hypothetical protein